MFKYGPFLLYLRTLSFLHVLMVDYSEIKSLSPFISFFFTHLGALLESSSGHRPQVGLFAFRDSALRSVLTDQYHLLRQSLNWFHSLREISVKMRIGFEVRFSELETGLSSSDNPVELEHNTTALVSSSSKPSSSKTSTRAFHALEEECTLDKDTVARFRDRFQFPEETGICLPRLGEKACAFAHSEVCFYEVAFLSGLRFFVHPFMHKLFHHLNVAPAKLMLNSWPIVISCMEIWMIIIEGDMIGWTNSFTCII